MRLPTRLRFQVLSLVAAVACFGASLSSRTPGGSGTGFDFTRALATAALSGLLFVWAWRLGRSRRHAFWLALIVGVLLALRPFGPAPAPGPAAPYLLAAGILLAAWTLLAAVRSDRESAAALAERGSPRPPGSPIPQNRTGTAAEIYDALVVNLGFDSEHPGWSPALRDLHRHARARRLQVIPEFFYTPVFSPADVPAAAWSGSFPDCGKFDRAGHERFLRDTPRFAELLASLPLEPPADEMSYYWNNEQFGHADAALYYSILRRYRPKRIVEVGSGHSTKLALRAVRDNGGGSILCIEPHPPRWLRPVPGQIAIEASAVQASPESVFLALEPGDVLFIDGSHISKTGSDVNHLMLRILPRLPAGVLVQIHDICLPFEYQRYWSEDVLCYWNEQYVVAGLLANSVKFEVLLGVYFLQRTAPDLLRPFLPDLPGVLPGGGSLWLRSS